MAPIPVRIERVEIKEEKLANISGCGVVMMVVMVMSSNSNSLFSFFVVVASLDSFGGTTTLNKLSIRGMYWFSS